MRDATAGIDEPTIDLTGVEQLDNGDRPALLRADLTASAAKCTRSAPRRGPTRRDAPPLRRRVDAAVSSRAVGQPLAAHVGRGDRRGGVPLPGTFLDFTGEMSVAAWRILRKSAAWPLEGDRPARGGCGRQRSADRGGHQLPDRLRARVHGPHRKFRRCSARTSTLPTSSESA